MMVERTKSYVSCFTDATSTNRTFLSLNFANIRRYFNSETNLNLCYSYSAVTQPGYRAEKVHQATLQENEACTVTTNNKRNTKCKQLVYDIPRIFSPSTRKRRPS
jgi:hypothetical protein